MNPPEMGVGWGKPDKARSAGGVDRWADIRYFNLIPYDIVGMSMTSLRKTKTPLSCSPRYSAEKGWKSGQLWP